MNQPEIKQGDVFRWSFREPPPRGSITTAYWCCSQFCIADDSGLLFDTYWGSGSSNKEVLPERCELKYLGNLNDYEPRDGNFVREKYRESDILDLRHGNGGACYLRKGAEPDEETMRRTIEKKIRDFIAERDHAARMVEHWEKALASEDFEKWI